MNEERLESRLSSLVKGNSPENRRKHALEAKRVFPTAPMSCPFTGSGTSPPEYAPGADRPGL
ncbi:MAG: hypothetical protein HW402_629 [Dehalococcoidales bacterium]|nr:hypothetical protein [Dehalococcoidales bacterium]